jgi:hypothetical protein
MYTYFFHLFNAYARIVKKLVNYHGEKVSEYTLQGNPQTYENAHIFSNGFLSLFYWDREVFECFHRFKGLASYSYHLHY